MNCHPGGEEHTRHLLELSALPKGTKILDMGAGAGEALQQMRAAGYDALGIDLHPRSEAVLKGDFLQTGFPDGSFDGVLSQCAFALSGNPAGAVREARRLLKPGGVLMLSDVFFEDPALPGFRMLSCEDMTPVWRDYVLDALWREDCGENCLPRGKCRYLSLIAVKEEENQNGFT